MAHVLQTTQDLVISRCCFAEDVKEMYQELKRTCTAIVLVIKSFVRWRSRCRCRRGFVNSLMIGKIGIAIALIGFNDLGRSETPTFHFRNRFYLQLSTLCPKTNKKSMREVKKIQDFCPRDMESCHLATARLVKLWSLNANLFFDEPHQLTKFAF